MGIATAELLPQQEKIDDVLAGRIKEARVSWWGFNADDSTKILQAALDSKVPKLIIDAMPSPWITERIYVHDNQELIFEKGCVLQAKRGSFRGTNDSLLNVIVKKNVSISGEGAVIRMWGDDYRSQDYAKAEWRHGISIISSENVKVSGLTVTDTGGDGIYIGVTGDRGPCKNIHIADVVCDNNHRQGISVISVEGLLIERTVMKNTRGTNPEAGIDFEPDNPSQVLTNCVMRDCVTVNNTGCGYSFYLVQMNRSSKPVSVRLENCISKGDGEFAFLLATRNGKERTVEGKMEIIGCRFENSGNHGINIKGKAIDGIDLSFDQLRLKDCGRRDETFPILIASQSEDETPVGKIRFNHTVVEDSKDRPFLEFKELSSLGTGLRETSGTFELVRDGKTDSVKVDDSWVGRHFPGRVSKWIPILDMNINDLVPFRSIQGNQVRDLPELKARSVGVFLFYAAKGDDLFFSMVQGRVSQNTFQDRPVFLTAPSGKSLEVNPLKANEETEFRISSVPETGVYRLDVNVGSHWVALRKSNRPVVLAAIPSGTNLIGSTGEFYFNVPQETKEFGIRIAGGGVERVKATLFDPSGKEVWAEDNIEEVVPFEATTPGVWKIKLEPPSQGILEDFRITLVGIPPWIGFWQDGLLVPRQSGH